MKLTIDREADALYLDLDSTPAAESEEIAPGVIFDYNADGKVVGIEMLNLSLRVSAEKLRHVEVENSGAYPEANPSHISLMNEDPPKGK